MAALALEMQRGGRAGAAISEARVREVLQPLLAAPALDTFLEAVRSGGAGKGLREGTWRVTLPSEAEWEKAAWGSDGRIYPWGNDWDNDKVNANENIGRPSAVGCFPTGKSPYDILDMSGNVWEWTRSLWGTDWDNPEFRYPYDPADKRREDLNASRKVYRVLRGGSWSDGASVARCAFRVRGSPDDRDHFAGCRCVLQVL